MPHLRYDDRLSSWSSLRKALRVMNRDDRIQCCTDNRDRSAIAKQGLFRVQVSMKEVPDRKPGHALLRQVRQRIPRRHQSHATDRSFVLTSHLRSNTHPKRLSYHQKRFLRIRALNQVNTPATKRYAL